MGAPISVQITLQRASSFYIEVHETNFDERIAQVS